MSTASKWVACLVAAVVLVGGAWVAWERWYSPGTAIVNALDARLQATATSPDAGRQQAVLTTLKENYDEVRLDATRWSAVFWGFTFTSLIASALAGVILKVESVSIADVKRRDVAAALALVASLTTAIATTGEFKQRWQANRHAAGKLENLGYRSLASEPLDVDDAFTEIAAIQLERTQRITGSEDGDRRPAGAHPAGPPSAAPSKPAEK